METSTSDLHDAHPETVGVCDLQFRSFGRHMRFAGPCQTLKVHEDHRRVKDLLASPGEGRVLVVDGGGSLRVGLLGDQLGALAVEHGWVGIVANGAIRDSDAIDTLALGVKALGTTARRSAVDMGGAIGLVIGFGGVAFHPGDWVYADRDAVLVSRTRLVP